MDYKSFINGMAMQSGHSADAIDANIVALVETMSECLCELDSVAIPAFGTFRSEKHDEYVAPGPDDGTITCYPPSISLNFNPSAMLKKRFCHE